MSPLLPSMVVAGTARAWGLLGAGAPTPTPTPDPALTIYTVTPGIGGFLAFFVLALAAWLLFRSMTKHMRVVDHNARVRRSGDGAGEPREGEPNGSPVDGVPPDVR